MCLSPCWPLPDRCGCMRPGLTAGLWDFLTVSIASISLQWYCYSCFLPLQRRGRTEQLCSLNNLPRSTHFLPSPYNLWPGEINSMACGKEPNIVMVKELSPWEQMVVQRNELSVRAFPNSRWKINDRIRVLQHGNTRIKWVKVLSVCSCGCCKKRTQTRASWWKNTMAPVASGMKPSQACVCVQPSVLRK